MLNEHECFLIKFAESLPGFKTNEPLRNAVGAKIEWVAFRRLAAVLTGAVLGVEAMMHMPPEQLLPILGFAALVSAGSFAANRTYDRKLEQLIMLPEPSINRT
jgi:hypothetical protein